MKYDAAFRRLFWSRVCKSKKGKRCWNWTAGAFGSGYGEITCKRVAPGKLAAHRVSWELANGRKIPTGKQVLHTCDNRRCCRPAHLYLGTDVENGKDRAISGVFKGAKNPKTSLTWAGVRKIRKRVAKGETQAAVARDVGLNFRTVSQIVLGDRWKEDSS